MRPNPRPDELSDKSSVNSAPPESGLIVQCGMREPRDFAARDKTCAHLLVMPDNSCEAEFVWRAPDGAKKTRWLQERHAIFIPKNVPCELHWKKPAAFAHMVLGVALVAGAATQRPVINVHICREWELAANDLLAHFLFNRIETLCRDIPFPGANPDAAAACRLLASLTIKILSARETGVSPGLPVPSLKRVEAYVDKNIGEQIRVRDLAREAGFGARHFPKLFKISTGMPPCRFVLLRRLEYAQLLRASGETKAAAAAATGFFDQRHLNNTIQRICGEGRAGRADKEKAQKLPTSRQNLQSAREKSGHTGATL